MDKSSYIYDPPTSPPIQLDVPLMTSLNPQQRSRSFTSLTFPFDSYLSFPQMTSPPYSTFSYFSPQTSGFSPISLNQRPAFNTTTTTNPKSNGNGPVAIMLNNPSSQYPQRQNSNGITITIGGNPNERKSASNLNAGRNGSNKKLDDTNGSVIKKKKKRHGFLVTT